MARAQKLVRDYGLALALVGVAALLWSRTTTPALKRADALEREHERLEAERKRVDAETKRLRAAEQGTADPETIERLHRDQFGAQGLPPEEVIVPAAPGERAAAPRSE